MKVLPSPPSLPARPQRPMQALLLGLLWVVACTASAATWRFGVIGDTPYTHLERELFPDMLTAMGKERLAFAIHAGDIKSGSSPCADAIYADRFQLFARAPFPLIYVPGDNEWTDCARTGAGGHDPQERLAHLRRIFFASPGALGQPSPEQASDKATPLVLSRQPGWPEHQRWQLGPVWFATLNIPGGNNHFSPEGRPRSEFALRGPAVLRWLRETFALARAAQAPGVVIVFQANPGFKHFAQGLAHSGYRELLVVLREETLNFAGEVLLIHGDTHRQRIDHPLLAAGSTAALPGVAHPPASPPRRFAQQARLTRFTRLETYGSPFMGWVTVSIDPTAPARRQPLFTFEAQPFPDAARR